MQTQPSLKTARNDTPLCQSGDLYIPSVLVMNPFFRLLGVQLGCNALSEHLAILLLLNFWVS